jgi:hypothetical protein
MMWTWSDVVDAATREDEAMLQFAFAIAMLLLTQ